MPRLGEGGSGKTKVQQLTLALPQQSQIQVGTAGARWDGTPPNWGGTPLPSPLCHPPPNMQFVEFRDLLCMLRTKREIETCFQHTKKF